MDNTSPKILNEKCQRFQTLYRGSTQNQTYCLGTNIGEQYMCPKISNGHIEEMPLSPWFSKQQDKCHKGQNECFPKQPLLGKYHLCPNQSNYSHYQNNGQIHQNNELIHQNNGQIHQNNGQIHQNNELIHRNNANISKSAIIENKVPISINNNLVKEQSGGVFTVHPDGYETISIKHSDPYQIYPAQEGYYVKRCVGDRNLYPDRQQSEFNQPIPPIPSKPKYPPLAREWIIESRDKPYGPQQVSIAGYGRPSYNLTIDDETPSELTNKFIMNANITPSYYPDMIQPMIGKRPVYTARNLENDIPEIITKNKGNFPTRITSCYQPSWSPKCI